MNLLSPFWLLLGLLALPILILYMLKLRRQEVEVSSTMLWQMLLRDRQANSPWQRLRRNLLLFLQLIILAGLVLAMARPARTVPSVATGSVVVILDGSASMNATDLTPSRFQAAQAVVHTLIDGLALNARMTIILAANPPTVLAAGENDKTFLRRALTAAKAGQGSADWQATFALAAGAVSGSGQGDTKTSIVIVSDGGVPNQGLPPLPGEVSYIPIGSHGDNLAVSALSIRSAGQSAELFASITNYGAHDRTAMVSLYQDERLLISLQKTIPAQQTINWIKSELLTDTVTGTSYFKLQIASPEPSSGPLDALTGDNTAFTVYHPPRQGNVFVVTPTDKFNMFIESFVSASLGKDAAIHPARTESGQIQMPATIYDLYIYDGVFPADPPAGASLLLINPPANPYLATTRIFSDTANIALADFSKPNLSDFSQLQFTDWSNVHIREARQVQAPWAQTLVLASGNPLVLAGEMAGRRIAVITFDLHASDLPLQVAYPILMSNLFNYLIPARGFEADSGLSPDQSITIRPVLRSGQFPQAIAVSTPSKKVYSLLVDANGADYTATGELGLYAVNYIYKDQGVDFADFFAVNLFDPSESNILPATSIQAGRASIPAAEKDHLSQHEFWPWFAVLALVVLLLEWLVYQRGQVLPTQWWPRIRALFIK